MPSFPPKTPRLISTILSFLFAKMEGGGSIALCGILFSGLFFSIGVYRPAFLSSLDNKLYDVMHRSLDTHTTPLPLIVDIDEKSLAQFGQWPWPRYRIAHLLEKLTDAGAAGIGLDIIFAEPDRTSLKEMQRDLRDELGLELELAGVPDALQDNDAVLANVLANGPYVIGYKFSASPLAGRIAPGLFPVDVIIIHDAAKPETAVEIPGATGVIAPLPVLAESTGDSGFVNIRPDNDGVVRRIPMLMRFKDKIYPSLALASVMKAVGAKRVFLKVSSLGIESLRLNKTVIPLDAEGNLLIRYRGGRKSIDYISVADILNDNFNRASVAGRVIFIGTSAAGLKDTHITPFDQLYPGTEVHASVADNILHGVFFKRPAWANGAELLVTLCVGVFVSIVLAWCRPWSSLLFVGFGSVVLWFGGLKILETGNIFLSPFYPLMTLGGIFPVLSLLKFRVAEKRAIQRDREIERIESELNVAREIQLGILPKVFPPFPEHAEFDIFANLIPAREVGGDFYDFFFIDKEHLCFTIGDVSDKGVPAALFMAITRTLVKNSAQHLTSPSDIMNSINQILYSDNPKVMFVTLIIGILNVRTGTVRYANGGHNPPILIRRGDGAEYKKDISGLVVGVMPGLNYKETTVTLGPDDAMFLYTDGVTEAMNDKGLFFSDERLLKELALFQHEPVDEVLAKILQNIRKHAGSAPQSDDIAMMMIRYNGRGQGSGISGQQKQQKNQFVTRSPDP
ncbi:MAG: CHASE2 domain-containing protein [Desulfobulbaceae bacterium]|nr:CHASE2 domain-containing protein [Desulfobulbaceae bacterium]